MKGKLHRYQVRTACEAYFLANGLQRRTTAVNDLFSAMGTSRDSGSNGQHCAIELLPYGCLTIYSLRDTIVRLLRAGVGGGGGGGGVGVYPCHAWP